MSSYEYLLSLCFVLLVTYLLHSHYKLKIFSNKIRSLILFCIYILIGILWDTLGVVQGFWMYPSNNNMGIVVGYLPVEEILYYLTVPYLVIVIQKLVATEERVILDEQK